MSARGREADALKAPQRIADLEFLITLLQEETASLRSRLGSNSVSSDLLSRRPRNTDRHPAAELLRFLFQQPRNDRSAITSGAWSRRAGQTDRFPE